MTHKPRLAIHRLSRKRFVWMIGCTVAFAVLIVITSAALGRARHNFQAALTEKPDIALYLLLPDERIGRSEVLEEKETERTYLADTKDGPKIIRLKKGEKEWYVAMVEKLHK